MKKLILIFTLVFLTLTSCKKATPKKTIVKPTKLEIKVSKKENNEIIFSDETSMLITDNMNFIHSKKIDSIHYSKKELKAVYKFCGKSQINRELIESIKELKKMHKLNLKKIHTAHSITNNKNDFYISSYTNVLGCLTENEIIRVDTDVFTFFSNKEIFNFLIICKIEKDV